MKRVRRARRPPQPRPDPYRPGAPAGRRGRAGGALSRTEARPDQPRHTPARPRARPRPDQRRPRAAGPATAPSRCPCASRRDAGEAGEPPRPVREIGQNCPSNVARAQLAHPPVPGSGPRPGARPRAACRTALATRPAGILPSRVADDRRRGARSGSSPSVIPPMVRQDGSCAMSVASEPRGSGWALAPPGSVRKTSLFATGFVPVRFRVPAAADQGRSGHEKLDRAAGACLTQPMASAPAAVLGFGPGVIRRDQGGEALGPAGVVRPLLGRLRSPRPVAAGFP